MCCCGTKATNKLSMGSEKGRRWLGGIFDIFFESENPPPCFAVLYCIHGSYMLCDVVRVCVLCVCVVACIKIPVGTR